MTTVGNYKNVSKTFMLGESEQEEEEDGGEE